jgi:hypothetical protein
MKIEITPVIGCSNNCGYCPQSELIKSYKSDKKIFTLEDFKKCIDKLNSCSFGNNKYNFSGFSEPLFHPYIFDLIDYALVSGDVNLFSTFLIDSELIKSNMSTISNIKNITVHIPDISEMNIDSSDINNWITNMAILEDCGIKFDYIHVGANDIPYEIRCFLVNSNKNVFYQELVGRAGLIKHAKQYDHVGRVGCKDNRHNQNVLLPNGDIVLCCMDYELKNGLGNLLTDDIGFIYDGFKKENLMQDKNSICRKCFRGVSL